MLLERSENDETGLGAIDDLTLPSLSFQDLAESISSPSNGEDAPKSDMNAAGATDNSNQNTLAALQDLESQLRELERKRSMLLQGDVQEAPTLPTNRANLAANVNNIFKVPLSQMSETDVNRNVLNLQYGGSITAPIPFIERPQMPRFEDPLKNLPSPDDISLLQVEEKNSPTSAYDLVDTSSGDTLGMETANEAAHQTPYGLSHVLESDRQQWFGNPSEFKMSTPYSDASGPLSSNHPPSVRADGSFDRPVGPFQTYLHDPSLRVKPQRASLRSEALDVASNEARVEQEIEDPLDPMAVFVKPSRLQSEANPLEEGDEVIKKMYGLLAKSKAGFMRRGVVADKSNPPSLSNNELVNEFKQVYE